MTKRVICPLVAQHHNAAQRKFGWSALPGVALWNEKQLPSLLGIFSSIGVCELGWQMLAKVRIGTGPWNHAIKKRMAHRYP